MRPTLPAARGSSQLAAIAESLVTDAERNRRVTCLLHIISDVTRVRHAQVLPSQSSVRSLLVLLLYKQRCLSCLARPVCLGQYRPLQSRSASDKCSVRCRPIKQRQNLPQLLIKTYLRCSTFLPFFQKFTANIAFGTIFEEVKF